MPKFLVLVSAFLLAINLAARAAPDTVLTPQQRAAAIEAITVQFEKIYFDPGVGASMARDLRARLGRGEYDAIKRSRQLADALNRHIDAICHESHTEVTYHEEDQLADAPKVDSVATIRTINAVSKTDFGGGVVPDLAVPAAAALDAALSAARAELAHAR